MILFILFWLALVILAGMLIALGFSFYFRNRALSTSEDQQLFPPDPQNYRPLFAPSAQDIAAFERAEKAAEKVAARAREQETALNKMRDNSAQAFEFLSAWKTAPDKKSLGELLTTAVNSDDAQTYFHVSQGVLQVWHNEKLQGLSAADLADLLESHFRLLPQQEIASGAGFLLKQEIATLRRESGGKK